MIDSNHLTIYSVCYRLLLKLYIKEIKDFIKQGRLSSIIYSLSFQELLSHPEICSIKSLAAVGDIAVK